MKVWKLIKNTFKEWNEDHAAQLAAALAYYTIFSLAPVLIITLAIAGQFFSQETARNQIMAQISSYAGAETARFIGTLLESSSRDSSGFIASVLSVVILLFGATGFFGQVQSSLNQIWEVPPQTGGLRANLKNRLRSFFMILGLGFLLLVFLIVSGVINAVTSRANPNSQTTYIFQAINFLVLFGFMTLALAMIFRVVPEKEITWKDVLLGAAITALLFVIGRYAISLYLTVTKSGSTYGAAGSLIVLLIWIYYSAQIFLLGGRIHPGVCPDVWLSSR